MSRRDDDCAGIPAPEAATVLLRDPALIQILDAIDRDGDETRIVGGALRNALFARNVHEIDLATTADPETVTARAKAAGLRCIPTGIDHGTVTLLVDGQSFEVTSLREDVETDGRRAKVRFGRDFEIDALRRDFTMNALSMGRDGRLHDYVGGLDDIAARKIRFIGEPTRRIREDYLRILRFFRFSAEFGEGPLDPAGLAAAMRERDGLASLSRERVRTETLKLLCARRAAEVCSEICAAGLLGPLLASAPNPARLRRAAAIVPSPPDPLLRLAAVCLYVTEDALRLRERLRLSNAEFGRLEAAAIAGVALHGAEAPPEPSDLRRLLYRHGRRAALDACTLAEAEARAPDAAAWEAARGFLHDVPAPHLPFSGADLMARGLAAGKVIGEMLKSLEDQWVAAGFPEDPGSLARLLDDAIASAKRQPRITP
ncbi:CCA tRNA nucleotidyltransferase [Methylocapsa acidiphila]|uniref:CCA tRNA nucleotidyltransferase n=1 Tax=Methylocapsa acidiphila TaxID=133552 RepID=UPI00041A8665|nr:CCA tRNA nucleotidyltransferase [Methylocapsa acidiphila]